MAGMRQTLSGRVWPLAALDPVVTFRVPRGRCRRQSTAIALDLRDLCSPFGGLCVELRPITSEHHAAVDQRDKVPHKGRQGAQRSRSRFRHEAFRGGEAFQYPGLSACNCGGAFHERRLVSGSGSKRVQLAAVRMMPGDRRQAASTDGCMAGVRQARCSQLRLSASAAQRAAAMPDDTRLRRCHGAQTFPLPASHWRAPGPHRRR